MPVSRTAIVAAARRFVGTPYHHQASTAGAGCDCLGLIRGVWRALYGPEPEDVVPYGRDFGDAEQVEVLLQQGERHLVPIAIAEAQAGDVVAFRMRVGRIAKHCAILSSDSTMIHAQSGDLVREVAFSAPWRRQVAAAFAFPGVSAEISPEALAWAEAQVPIVEAERLRSSPETYSTLADLRRRAGRT